MSYCEVDSRGRLRDKLWDPFQVFLPERFFTPSSWSIICSSSVWSSALSGATEMSRTARNSPQLFRCSFSRRKKFHTKRLRGEGEEGHGGFSTQLEHLILSWHESVRMLKEKVLQTHLKTSRGARTVATMFPTESPWVIVVREIWMVQAKRRITSSTMAQ